jgi:hypothetical protein
MTQTEVRRILGKPDDLRTGKDVRGGPNDSSEEWCFGTDGHLTFPSLGTIWFEGKEVVLVAGGTGTPPPRSLFNEEELRDILAMLGHDGQPPGNLSWDPVWGIKAVNTLVPLGKHKALAALEEFLRITPSFLSFYEVSFLLRVLFDVPKDTGYMPGFRYPIQPGPPDDIKRVPRFPILILGDVPLEIAFGSGLGGDSPYTNEEILAAEIAFSRDHATMRLKPLQPTDKPLQVFSQWKAYEWVYRDRRSPYVWTYSASAKVIKKQLHQLLKTIYRGDVENGALSEPVRWDMKRNIYTFLDGKTLPPEKEQNTPPPLLQ